MNTQTISRQCQCCDKPLRGRADKKFCDDYCRNIFNNHLKAATYNYVRNVNHALGKNRRVLEGLFAEGKDMTKTTKEKLLQRGFLFKYMTHFYKNKKGNTYYFCYDYGYMPLNNELYLLVRRKEEN